MRKLWVLVGLYVLYFGVLSVERFKTLYASYYDLGIMHQTVYNTFRAIQSGDFSRFLEMTNTIGPDQIKRMAIHNDMLLALLAPFYFVNASPVTLLVIQTIVLALGAVIIYKLCLHVFERKSYRSVAAYLFAIAWLLYPPLQRSNLFDFHAVVLATTLLAGMYYFWLIKRYRLAIVLFILSILAKEQVALTTAFFGVYVLASTVQHRLFKHPLQNARKILLAVQKNKDNYTFGLLIIGVSTVWFLLSFFLIIPGFRGEHHFATVRYGELGTSPADIILTVATNPVVVWTQIMNGDPFVYLYNILGPLGFLSLLSPFRLLIAASEFAINLLSNEPGMRNIIYHYTAVLTPFVFISAIYGFMNAEGFLQKWVSPHLGKNLLLTAIAMMVFGYSFVQSPLPYSRSKEIHPFAYPQKEAKYAHAWARILKDESIKIAATGQLAPHFTGRRYFYTFSKFYPNADYVIVRPAEVYNSWEGPVHVSAYEKLVKDARFKLIEKKDNFEVYKKQ